jgi:hypothetical protein
MTLLTSATTFTVTGTVVREDYIDLILLPENNGVDAFRELHYPNNDFPTLIYSKNPDKWTNFDRSPLTARPVVKYAKTLEAGQLTRWTPYIKDSLVKETWEGGGSKLSMQAYFFRRLWEYYANPPAENYIEWYPKDRTTAGYYIEIDSLSVGGEEVAMDYLAMSNDYILDAVVLAFRVIGVI